MTDPLQRPSGLDDAKASAHLAGSLASINREIARAAAILAEAGFVEPPGRISEGASPAERFQWGQTYSAAVKAWIAGDPGWDQITLVPRLAADLVEFGFAIEAALLGARDGIEPKWVAVTLFNFSIAFGISLSALTRWRDAPVLPDDPEAELRRARAAVAEFQRNNQERSVEARTPWRDPARAYLRPEMARRPHLSNDAVATLLIEEVPSQVKADLRSKQLPGFKAVSEWVASERRRYVETGGREGLPPKGYRV